MKSGIILTKRNVIVIIGTIVFLIMNLAAVEQRGREHAKRTVCLANLKQLTAACNVFADENEGRLPLPGTTGAWLEDVAINTVHSMLDTGITRKMFYCPSNTAHQKYNDLFWMFNNDTWDGERFTRESGFVVSGYCFILETMYGRRQDITAYENDTEEKIWLRTNQESSPATRELCVDTIMGMPRSNTKYGYEFGQIPGGLWAQGAVFDRTNHLITNEEPAGGNIGFLDGHGQWREFNPDLDNSGKAIPRWQGQNSPAFFW